MVRLAPTLAVLSLILLSACTSADALVRYVCPDHPDDPITATFLATDPSTVRLERGDQHVVATLAPSASGARYVVGDVEFWSRGDEAMVTWGPEAEPRTYQRHDPEH